MTPQEQAYYNGFQAQCERYGIDQQTTIKLAQVAEQMLPEALVPVGAEGGGMGRLGAYLSQLIPFYGPGFYGVDTKANPEDSSLWEGLKSVLATPVGQAAGGVTGAIVGNKISPLRGVLPGAILGALVGGGEALHATKGD